MVRNLLEQESLHRRQDHLQLHHLHPCSRCPLVRACPSIPPVPHPRQGLLQPQRHGMRYYFLICGCLMEHVYSQSFGIQILLEVDFILYLSWKATTEAKVLHFHRLDIVTLVQI